MRSACGSSVPCSELQKSKEKEAGYRVMYPVHFPVHFPLEHDLDARETNRAPGCLTLVNPSM